MKRLLLLCTLSLLCLTMAGCGTPKPAADNGQEAQLRTCEAVAATIREGDGFETLTALSAKQTLEYLDIDEASVSDTAMEIDASRATAEMIVVITAADADALKTVQEALTAYRNSMLGQYRDYRPDEVPKLESAVLQTRGLQTVLVVGKDPAKIEQAVTAAW